MKREKRRCKHCCCLFEVCRKVKTHEYCKKGECQKARKASAQRRRMAGDPQYKQDQNIAQKDWRATHPDYWKEYRTRNQRYAERNRDLQRDRNRHRGGSLSCRAEKDGIAKMDVLSVKNGLYSGRYKMLPVLPRGVAKMTPIIVEIDVIKGSCACLGA